MARRLLVSLLALGLYTVALGAESKLQPPELDQYLRWGALRVRPGVELTNVGYDDNILYNDDNKVSDFTATISPKAEILVLFGDRFLPFRSLEPATECVEIYLLDKGEDVEKPASRLVFTRSTTGITHPTISPTTGGEETKARFMV